MSLKTIIVDDDPMVVFAMKRTLEKTQFFTTPDTFENGLLAFNFFKKHYNPGDCYVIFLDINMPVMNGWEFLGQIAGYASPENTMVFIVTSSIDQSDIKRASSEPLVQKFISKPVTNEIISEVRDLLQEKVPALRS